MQTACEVRRVLSKHPNRHKTSDLKMEFKPAQPIYVSTLPMNEEAQRQRAALSKAYWLGGMGTGVAHVTVSAEEMARLDALPPEEAARARRALARVSS